MPLTFLELPDELILCILEHFDQFAEKGVLSRLSICSRRLHRIVTPVLYRQLKPSYRELPLLLRSLIRNPDLRGDTRKIALLYNTQDEYQQCDSRQFEPATDDSRLLQATITEVLKDDAWKQAVVLGWCNERYLTYGYDRKNRRKYRANELRWYRDISIRNDWNAQFALLLSLMSGLTYLRVYSNEAPAFGNAFHSSTSGGSDSSSSGIDVWSNTSDECKYDGLNHDPKKACIYTVLSDPGEAIGPPNYFALLMLAAANTQQRAISANRAPRHAGGVLPHLRLLRVEGASPECRAPKLLPLVLPPLVERLELCQLGCEKWVWECFDCAPRMATGLNSMLVERCKLEGLPFQLLMQYMGVVKELIGCPTAADENASTSTMLEALEAMWDLLKVLDLSGTLIHNGMAYWREYASVAGDFRNFWELEKLSFSAEKMVEYWFERHAYDDRSSKRMLCRRFPPSLKELAIFGTTAEAIMFMTTALLELLDTEKMEALQLITLGVVQPAYLQVDEAVDLRLCCEARGIGFVVVVADDMTARNPPVSAIDVHDAMRPPGIRVRSVQLVGRTRK